VIRARIGRKAMEQAAVLPLGRDRTPPLPGTRLTDVFVRPVSGMHDHIAPGVTS
jgi:hypothetical protein